MLIIFISGFSIYTKHRKTSFLSLENPWKLVELHFITAPNVKSVRNNISGGRKFELKSLIVKIEHNVRVGPFFKVYFAHLLF